MFGSLLAGTILAVGHDQFYRYLDGRFVVGGDGLDHGRVSPVPQEWVIRIGTAFAFLVKTLLVVAACIAYSQRMWYNLNTSEFRVRHIDSLTSVLVNIFSFWNLRLWGHVPVLALIGLAVWALAIVAVVTPGTLTVIPTLASNETLLRVPQLSYNVSRYAQNQLTSGNYAFTEASGDVRRVAFASATSGSILPIPHPFVNMTYTLSFPGPAIQCGPANDTVVAALTKTLPRFSGTGGSVLYLSWVGDTAITAPFLFPATWNISTWGPEQPPRGTLDSISDDAAKLFVMSGQGPRPATTRAGDRDYNPFSNVTCCTLHNATYTTRFTFDQAVGQRIEMLDLRLDALLPVLDQPASSVDGIQPAEGEHMAFQAVMDAVGKLLVGSEHGRTPTTSSTVGTSFKLSSVRWESFEETQRDLEELFRNATLSMFASRALTLDEAESAPVPVTVISYPPSYRYAPKGLLITYGTGVLVTLLATLIGTHAIWLNGGKSYSTKFSTFIRIVRGKELDEVVGDHDRGWNPLPKKVGDARLALHRGSSGSNVNVILLQENLKDSERRLVIEGQREV
ncbi:hypothetical protein V8F20_010965 [Naviculisporaceae sp. PSN 640]